MASDAASEPPGEGSRRIVLAAISVDDEAIEALAPVGHDRDGAVSIPTPGELRWTRLRFRAQAAWWATAATIGIGASPDRHGVLTALAIDEDGRGTHPRRECDSDRPWIWQRFERAGRRAVVCGWPALADLREPGVPAATNAAVLAPRRLEAAAEASAGVEPRADGLAAVLRPPDPDLARGLATAVRQAISAVPFARPHDDALRTVEAICTASERLEAWPDGRSGSGAGASLRCLGLQLRTERRDDDEIGHADEDSDEGDRNARRQARGERLAATLARLCRDLGPDDVLLAAVFGDRTGRLWHRGLAIEVEHATAIDIVPTLLAVAGLPVPADLSGTPLHARDAAPSRSWDLSGWGAAETACEGEDVAVPVAERVRRARATLREFEAESSGAGDEAASRLRAVLLRHLETCWSLAIELADWSEALLAIEGLVEVRGAPIDLWRRAFAAERSGRREIAAEAIAALRAEHPDDPATSLAALLESGLPSRDLIESIDLATLRIPTQRSVVGRAAARLGLDEIAQAALAPLVAADRTIPADHMVLANLLLRLGEGRRALAALGGLGRGPSSPKRIRLLRAKCLAAADRRHEAIELLDRLLVETPFDTEARTLRERIAAGG